MIGRPPRIPTAEPPRPAARSPSPLREAAGGVIRPRPGSGIKSSWAPARRPVGSRRAGPTLRTQESERPMTRCSRHREWGASPVGSQASRLGRSRRVGLRRRAAVRGWDGPPPLRQVERGMSLWRGVRQGWSHPAWKPATIRTGKTAGSRQDSVEVPHDQLLPFTNPDTLDQPAGMSDKPGKKSGCKC
jgi:hypothetical protein